MKKQMTTLGKGLLGKLALAAALLTAGNTVALANTIVFDVNNIANGWTNGGTTGNFTASTGSVSSKNNPFDTTTAGQLSPANGYTWYSLTSDEAVPMTADRTLEVGVKSFNSYGGELIVRYSEDGTTFTNAADITTELRSNDAMANFNTFTISIPEGDQYIQIIGKAIYINSVVITGEAAALTTPKLTVMPSKVEFGALRTGETKTVTVTNAGVGTMAVTIACDNTTDFTLSATELTEIGEGQSKTFDVTFNYNAESLGEKTATITVTPDYNAEAVVNVEVTATAADANVWEDFTNGVPSTWYNEKDSWLNHVKDMEGMASPGYNSSHVLRTPRLYAEQGEALGFDVKIVGKYSSNVVTSRYSTDRVNWSDKVTYSADGTYSIVAPATGYYWVEFTASQAGIDNMTGWKIADAIHDTRLGTITIPAKGTAHGTYTASVVIMELGGSDETVNVELYFGETKVAEQTSAIGGNRDVTVELSYLPTEEWTGDAYIKVTGENIGTLETAPVALTITETPYVFDENSDENPIISNNSVVKVKYTAQKGWNTIVMPFSLSGTPAYMNTLFGEGWTAYTIDNFDEGKIQLKASTYLATSTPLLVYAPNAEPNADGVYLQNVSAGSYNWSHKNINQEKGDITFKGTFKPIAAPELDGKYIVTNEGLVEMADSETSIKAYHAYLELKEEATVNSLVLVVDGNEVTTAIGSLVNTLQHTNGQQVYNLSGQRVEKAGKGLYIVNGKKIVVK